ncbi:MAG: hypothetical protein AAF696_24760, partial [Bacteroidota bacterium]
KLNEAIGNNRIKFIDQGDPLDQYFKEGEVRNIYTVFHETISWDTIDVIIIERKLKVENGKKLILISCGGTLGYIPDGRFIFDPQTYNWNFQSRNDIVEEKIKL